MFSYEKIYEVINISYLNSKRISDIEFREKKQSEFTNSIDSKFNNY